MAEDIKPAPTPPTFDPNIQTEKIAFDADALVTCGGCGRTNPPNRFKCIYCAHELETAAFAVDQRPVLRKLEMWEHGFNLVVIDRGEDVQKGRAADLLSIDAGEVEALLASGVPLPIARVEVEKEALYLQEKLRGMGLTCVVVADTDLFPERLPVRLRGIEISGREISFQDFNTRTFITASLNDLLVAVAGRLTTGRVDMTQKRGRGGKSKLLDETATGSDESVLDIYLRGDKVGFRINQAGFDFSCLGSEKTLLAGDNIRRLPLRFIQSAPDMAIVDSYDACRQPLGSVWEMESRNDPQGLRRSGYRVEFGNIATTNNLVQFTKYSRLQRHLYEIKATA